MAIRRSNMVAVAVGMVGTMFTLLAYEQTVMTSMKSTLLGFVILLIALVIKEFDLVGNKADQP